MKIVFIYSLVALLLAAVSGMAQVNTADTAKLKPVTDTTKVGAVEQGPRVYTTDTTGIVLRKKPFEPNPKKAGMYSALLPGAGQVYNRQYWKVPVIYALGAVAIYAINTNLQKYNDYHTSYINRIANPNYVDKYSIYSIDNLKTLQDEYKKDLDLTVLATGVAYMLQVMDAVVFAYLKNFDVSRDISFRMKAVPTMQGPAVGVAMNFK